MQTMMSLPAPCRTSVNPASRTLTWPGQSPADLVTRAVREFEQTREWRRDVLLALDDAVRSLSANELARALARATRPG